MNSIVIDQYTLVAEILFENEKTPLTVRWIATNTDDKSTAEAWLTLEWSLDLLEFVYGEHADSQMQLLREHLYLELIAQQSPKSLCILNTADLLRFDFSASDLRY